MMVVVVVVVRPVSSSSVRHDVSPSLAFFPSFFFLKCRLSDDEFFFPEKKSIPTRY
jgi:hypothetical protein